MPPPTKIKLLRTDGTSLEATPEQAEKLKVLGYREETPEERGQALETTAREDFYSSPEQQAFTAVEGLGRGMTLGLSDYMFASDQTGQRAQHNPGIAAATEITGAILPELIPGLGAIAPSAMVGRGARAAVEGSSLVAKTARGAIEGGAFGGAMAADHAYISGDPVTSEAVLHGIGWGSLFGAGMAGAGGLIGRRGASNIAKGAAQIDDAGRVLAGGAAAEGAEASLAVREAQLAGERAALSKAELQARGKGPQFESAPGSYATTAEPAFAGFRAEAKSVASDSLRSLATTEAILTGNRRQMANLGFTRTVEEGAMARARTEVDGAFRRFSKALNKKGFSEEKVQKALEAYEATVAKAADKAGLTATGSGRQALTEFAQAKLVQKELQKFPHSAEAFAKMSDKRAETLFATLNEAKKLSNYTKIQGALEDQANAFQEALGVTPNGVDGLRGAWKAAQKALKAEKSPTKFTDFKMKRNDLAIREAELQAERAAAAEAKAKAPKQAEYEPGLIRRGVANAAGFGAFKATTVATGHPFVAMGVGSKVRNWVMKAGAPKTPELLAARNATLGRINMAVGKYQVGAGKVMSVAGPKLSPLALKLDGSPDTSSKDPSTLAYNRIAEFSAAAPHVKDTLYRAIEPIAVEQPELGPALHQAGVSAFNAIRALFPTDPGVVSGLKPIWKPSSLQAAVMSRQLSVWQDPVGAAEEMLASGIYDPIRVKTMKEIAPAVFEHLRGQMLMKIQEPGFLDKMAYRDQVAMGSMLDIPIHSSMRPEFIAASQQLHMNRNQPLPSPAIPGSTNGGRPAADNPGATAAQISILR